MPHNPQILFVTGKGGVGKTSVSLMLALAQAKRGRKTILVQTHGAQQIASFFDRQKCGYTPKEVYPNLFVMSITAAQAIEEYALQQLKFRKVYELIFENRFAKPLIQGAPGLHDAVHLGKIYDLAEREQWPSIIVDAPATGHALSMLNSARTMMELTKSGPMYNSNSIVDAVFSDPNRTSIVLVTLLEELPVHETKELWDALGPKQKQCRLLVHNKTISAPPKSPCPLQGDWKIQSDMLLSKYVDQQEQQSTLNYVLCPHAPLPIIPTTTVETWSTFGEQLLQTIEGSS